MTITPSRSTTTGCTKPYCRILSATLATCAASCLLALARYGVSSANRLFSICIRSPPVPDSGTAPASGRPAYVNTPRIQRRPSADQPEAFFCGFAGRADEPPEPRGKGKEYFRGCSPRKTAVYSEIAQRFSRPRAARRRADAEIAGMSWTPASSNKDARGVFFEGGHQSHRSGVRGGADGAYCRWLSGCSSS